MTKRGKKDQLYIWVSVFIILLIAMAAGIGYFFFLSQEPTGDDVNNETNGADDGSGDGGNTGTTSSACSDGSDNDFDGAVDYPDDFGCDSPDDDDESSVLECGDGLDNDNDGFVDQDDSLCGSALDDNEDFVDSGDSGGSSGSGSDDGSSGGSDPVCGDGSVEGSEQCDDGNIMSQDGCSSQCTWEFEIILENPEDNSVLGENESLPLNFTVIDGENKRYGCYYNIDDGGNITIAGCNDTTYNISEGSHTLTVYMNSSSELASDSSSFAVSPGSPAVSLDGPEDKAYTNDDPVTFTYYVVDTDLASCGLLGDFEGTYELIVSNPSPNNNDLNTFAHSFASEGTYLWAVSCNDTMALDSTTSNRTLFVDQTDPEITLSEPSGEYYFVNNDVPVKFVASDQSPIECEVVISAPSSTTSQDVPCTPGVPALYAMTPTEKGTYTISVIVVDEAGNSNSVTETIEVIETSEACSFVGASWSEDSAQEGDSVDMQAEGNDEGLCDGQSVDFEIYDDNDNLVNMIEDVEFTGTGVSAVWTSVGSDDSGDVQPPGGLLILPLLMNVALFFIFLKSSRKGYSFKMAYWLVFSSLILITALILAGLFLLSGPQTSLGPSGPVASGYYFVAKIPIYEPDITIQSEILEIASDEPDVQQGMLEASGSESGDSNTAIP